jgi:hypothetical protein
MESMSKTRTGLIAAGAFTFLMLGACGGGGGSTKAAPAANAGVAETMNAGGTATTSTETSTPTLQDPAPGSAAGTGQASRAFVDPITGQLRAPTAAELAALATPQPPQSSESVLKQRPPPPVQTRLPDGTIMYDMRNQPQIEEQACVLADGRIGACPAQKRAAP